MISGIITFLSLSFENIYSKYIVAKLEDEIIGFAGVWFVIDEAHITNIVTKSL